MHKNFSTVSIIFILIYSAHQTVFAEQLSTSDIIFGDCNNMPLILCNPEQAQTIKKSTITKKSKYHIIFREYIYKDNQKSWKQGYDAIVELWLDGKLKGTFKGSTLPNNIRISDSSYEYSVLMSTCHHNRFYTWKRGLRADGKRSALRLQNATPTVKVSSARDIVPKYLSQYGHFKFAKNILVHSGYKTTWRGSAGCLTINPEDSKAFFKLIPNGVLGTLEVSRQLGRPPTTTCY